MNAGLLQSAAPVFVKPLVDTAQAADSTIFIYAKNCLT